MNNYKNIYKAVDGKSMNFIFRIITNFNTSLGLSADEKTTTETINCTDKIVFNMTWGALKNAVHDDLDRTVRAAYIKKIANGKTTIQ